MDKYKEKILKVELIKTTKYYTEFIEGFKDIKYWEEKEKLKDKAKHAQYEIEICSLTENTPILFEKLNKTRFEPLYKYNDDNKWPDVKKFSETQVKYYERRLEETHNLFLKLRYSDYLFEYGHKRTIMNKYEISKYLLSALIEIIECYNETCNYFSLLARLVQVSLLMGNKEKLAKSFELMNKQINECDNNTECSYLLNHFQLIREILTSKYSEVVSQYDMGKLKRTLNENLDNYWENKNYEGYRKLVEELIEYSEIIPFENINIIALKNDIGKTYELEAEYQQGRAKKSLLVKLGFLEKAMKLYKEIGNTEKVNEMKIRIKKNYEEYEKSDEMNLIEIPISISILKKYIDQSVESIISSNIQNSLDNIAYSDYFIPNISQIEKQFYNFKKEYPLQSLIPISILSGGKKVESASSEEKINYINLNNHYTINVYLHVELKLKTVFEKMIKENKISTEDFMDKLSRWELLDSKNTPFIRRGIERFLKGDYISAVHILVPQFESITRNMFFKAGYPTTSIKKGNTQHEETFNTFLNREDIKETLGKDIHKLIKFVMIEQSGFNLRNEIAHGLIEISKLDYSKCILVIYLILIMTRFEKQN